MAASSTPSNAEALTTTVLEPYRAGLQDVSLTRWTCVFSSDRLEQAYRQHVYDEQIKPVLNRVVLLLIGVLIVFVGIDRLVVPDVFATTATVRLAVLLPMWLLWFLVSKHIEMKPEWVTWSALTATGAVVALFLWVGAVAEPPGNWLYLMYVATFSMAAPAIARWGLTVATAFTVTIAVVASAIAFSLDLPTPVLVAIVVVHAISSGFGLLVGTLVEASTRRTFVQQRLLELEQARSDRLLHNVLPDSIAQRLKSGERRVADRYDDASVLFCDLVGFTPLASGLDADEVVTLLDRLFSRFDDIVGAAPGLEKIKTVGDAYVVAGGVPEPLPHHVRAIADLALELLRVVRTYREAGGADLHLRIGIHRGPLVAGVIGKRRFVYDLWGDTVNVASRIEGLSAPGRTLITEEVAGELRSLGYLLEPAGTVDVKGKGDMTAWWLVGPPGDDRGGDVAAARAASATATTDVSARP